jgi:hypothetical protein
LKRVYYNVNILFQLVSLFIFNVSKDMFQTQKFVSARRKKNQVLSLHNARSTKTIFNNAIFWVLRCLCLLVEFMYYLSEKDGSLDVMGWKWFDKYNIKVREEKKTINCTYKIFGHLIFFVYIWKYYYCFLTIDALNIWKSVISPF